MMDSPHIKCISCKKQKNEIKMLTNADYFYSISNIYFRRGRGSGRLCTFWATLRPNDL